MVISTIIVSKGGRNSWEWRSAAARKSRNPHGYWESGVLAWTGGLDAEG